MKTDPIKAYDRLSVRLSALPIALCPAYVAFHAKHRELFLTMPASVKGHHSYPGGYAVHVDEVVENIARLVQEPQFGAQRPALSDAIVAAYLHDLDKLLWRYELDTEEPTPAQLGYAKSLGLRTGQLETKTTLSKRIDARKSGQPDPDPSELPVHRYRKDARNMDDSAAVLFLAAQHGLGGITEDIVHAISLHHGGWAPLAVANRDLRLSPLATLLHCADLISAQVQRGEVE